MTKQNSCTQPLYLQYTYDDVGSAKVEQFI